MKALSAWLRIYERGKIDLRSKENITKDSVAVKYKLRGKGDLGNSTWEGDLRLIADALAEQNDAEAAEALAEAAAVGLEGDDYTYSQAPYLVRSIASEALGKMSSQSAKDALVAGARGDWKGGKKADALRAAALLALGATGDQAHVDLLTGALSDGSTLIRIHAVDGLAKLGGDAATKALIGVVERETDDAVLVTAAKALRDIYADFVQKNGGNKPATDDKAPPAPPTARLAVDAAIQALGRTTWRADMVLVRLLDDFRTVEAVPALIAVLERFQSHPEEVESGRLSGLLQVRVHELLVEMTGAVFSANEPARWRELWEKSNGKIAITSKAESVQKKTGYTSAAGFAGIPVEGTRVVFILDLSGSMEWPMDDTDGKGKVKRLDYAKRELLKAVDALPENSMFNLVTFNGDDEAEDWSKKLVDASDRNKKRLANFVEKLRPLGGTNLWSGMEAALNIKSLVLGNHYETSVDEIFLLSDGAPSVGDVIDPVEILRLVHEINRFKEVRINTVFISSQTPTEARVQQPNMSLSPAELMKRMARENGGKFREI